MIKAFEYHLINGECDLSLEYMKLYLASVLKVSYKNLPELELREFALGYLPKIDETITYDGRKLMKICTVKFEHYFNGFSWSRLNLNNMIFIS